VTNIGVLYHLASFMGQKRPPWVTRYIPGFGLHSQGYSAHISRNNFGDHNGVILEGEVGVFHREQNRKKCQVSDAGTSRVTHGGRFWPINDAR